MTRLGALVGALALTASVSAGTAGAASASTFYVNGTTGADTRSCTEPSAACKTIQAAVEKSDVVLGHATIEVASGTYTENVDLGASADNGIVIDGAGDGVGGTVIEGAKVEHPVVEIGSFPATDTATLSNLSVLDPATSEKEAIESEGEVTLANVAVHVLASGDRDGISAEEIGSLRLEGGNVTMGAGNTGTAIAADAVPSVINGVQITLASGATGAGLEVGLAAVEVLNTTVNLGNTAEGPGLELELPKPFTGKGVTVTTEDSTSHEAAVEQEFGSSTFDHLQVSSAADAPGFEQIGGSAGILDSQLIEPGTEPALVSEESGEGQGLLLQSSVVETSATAEAALAAVNSNVTLDSSEVLGGKDAILMEQIAPKERTLTVAGSTIDAGKLGERDGAGSAAVDVKSTGAGVLTNVSIVGSIALEPQLAELASGSVATTNCSYSDIPSQSQAPTATTGAINCAAGASGNADTEPATLFAAPITAYQLNPASSAVDAVPAGATALPFGLTASSTDLAGNPRSESIDCVALQDKGALELPGHAIGCPKSPPALPPPPPPAKPLAGIISALSISPSAFFAAPSGATISTAKKYGAKIGYRDSQVATSTFTVLRQTSGRRQGKSCKKPSKANKHGKRCTLLTAVGSFTHVDLAGVNSLHFSGRIKGKKLAPGNYRLQVVAHDAAGNGTAVDKSFTIK